MTVGSDAGGGALGRVLNEAGGPSIIEILAERLSGADLTTLLLEVVRRRAAKVSPRELLHRHSTDRFVGPAAAPFAPLRRTEDAVLAALSPVWEIVVLSPLVPLGSHSAITTVHQNRVVSTMRGSEVAADPTIGLALEAAARRRVLLRTDPRSIETIRLAAFQRVVRGQRFDAPRAFAHFELFGAVTAGRDVGGVRFEEAAASEHIRFAVDALVAAGAARVLVELTDLGGMGPVADAVRAALADIPQSDVVDKPERSAGRGYYTGLCFKAFPTFGGDTFEVADGGFVDWTQHLVASKKERLFISGLGLDRVALAIAPDTEGRRRAER